MEVNEIHIESINLNDSKDVAQKQYQNDLKVSESQPNIDFSSGDFIHYFSSLISDQMNKQDLIELLKTQRQIISKLDTTNKNVVNEHQLSAHTYVTYALQDFQSYTATLSTMKQDLEFIFKRIRVIKNKLELKYSEQYSSSVSMIKEKMNPLELEEDEVIEATVNKVYECEETDEKRDRSTTVQTSSSTSSYFGDLIQSARERINSTSLITGLASSHSENPCLNETYE